MGVPQLCQQALSPESNINQSYPISTNPNFYE